MKKDEKRLLCALRLFQSRLEYRMDSYRVSRNVLVKVDFEEGGREGRTDEKKKKVYKFIHMMGIRN